MHAAVQVENPLKRVDRTLAADKRSFAVPGWEWFAMSGPNGAGKTTTGTVRSTLLRQRRPMGVEN
jgi:ABC-type multidrug transport system ATPase subunit